MIVDNLLLFKIMEISFLIYCILPLAYAQFYYSFDDNEGIKRYTPKHFFTNRFNNHKHNKKSHNFKRSSLFTDRRDYTPTHTRHDVKHHISLTHPILQKRKIFKKQQKRRKIYKKTQMFVVDPSEYENENDGENVVNTNGISNDADVDDYEVNDVTGDRKESINRNPDELIINDDGDNAEYLTSTNDNDDVKDSESLESSKFDNAVLTTQLSSSPAFLASTNPIKPLQNERYFQLNAANNPIQKVIPITQLAAQQPLAPQQQLAPQRQLVTQQQIAPQQQIISQQQLVPQQQQQRHQTQPHLNRIPAAIAIPVLRLPSKLNAQVRRPTAQSILSNSVASNIAGTIDNLNMGGNSDGNILLGDSLKDGLSTPFIESNVMIQNNQMKGHYLPIHDHKSLYKAQLPKQLEEGAQLGMIQSPLGFLTPKIGSFMPGDKAPIDKSILKAITEEVKKDNKFFISPSYADTFQLHPNDSPAKYFQLNLTQVATDEAAAKHSDEGKQDIGTNKEFLQQNNAQNQVLEQQAKEQLPVEQIQNQEQLQANLFTPVSSSDKETDINALTDNIVTSQNNFFRYGQTLLKKNPTISQGIDVQPSLSSLTPSEQHLISSIDKNVRKKLAERASENKILLPTKADALSDRTVAPSEQLLDMLARGKFKDPLSEDVLNKLALFDPNQLYLNEAGLQPLTSKMPEKFAKIGSEYVPIHSIAVNIPRTTQKPFIDSTQLAKAEMLMKTNPAYIGQNQQLLDANHFKTIQDLNNIGETIFPNHVVSVAEPKPIANPIPETASRKTDTMKYAPTTQDKIDLKEQQSELSPSERKQAEMLQHQHATSNDARVTLHDKKPPAYIQEIIQRQNQIDETLKSFEDALAETPHTLPPLLSSANNADNNNDGGTKYNKDADANAQCKFNPCLNAGTCTAQPDGYRCSCKIGWIGMNCEKRSNCFPNPCHHGICSPNIESYTCTCKLGYKGTHCDIIDRCNPNPCNNRGICTETSKDVSCECTPGFKGKLCEQEAHCLPLNPCMNGGTCNEFYDHYRCNCPADFRGQNCEAYLTPTKPPPTMPLKHVGPQAIPPPEMISGESRPVDIEAVNINRHSDEEKLPSFVKSANSGDPLAPRPILKFKNLEIQSGPDDIFTVQKESESAKSNENVTISSLEPKNDDRYQTHMVESQNSESLAYPNAVQSFKTSADEKLDIEKDNDDVSKEANKKISKTKLSETVLDSQKESSVKTPFISDTMSINEYDVSNRSRDMSDSNDELQKYSRTKYKVSTDENTSSYSRDSKSNQSNDHEIISHYARAYSENHENENSDNSISKNYLKLEEQHFKSSEEENPKFDYLHLQEAHGNLKNNQPSNKDFSKIGDTKNMKNKHTDDVTIDIKEPTKGPTLSNSESSISTSKFATSDSQERSSSEPTSISGSTTKKLTHEIENRFNSHEIKLKPKNISNYQTTFQNSKPSDDVLKPEKPKYVSGKQRSEVNVLRYRTPTVKSKAEHAHYSSDKSPITKVNIDTIASEAQKQVDMTAASIQQAKENAVETNDTYPKLPQEDVDQMKLVEQKANQIYAGIKAGIKDPVPIGQEKEKANSVISSINRHIQEKMRQAKEVNTFWERSFSNQKDAYSAWRKKALINFHNRNPTQPLPKNTVSLSKNSLCPGFCKLYCDPWCIKIGCCKTTDDQLALFENIEREHQNHVAKKALSPCSKCNENADCVDNRCVCKTGFHGNGQTCSINNCLLCHLDADCVGERCVCKPGFHGDGYECKKDSKDLTLPAYKRNLCPKCYINGYCVSGHCQCKRGFFGNGRSCWPLPII